MRSSLRVCTLVLFHLCPARSLISLHRSDAGAATSSSYSQLHLNVVSDSQLAAVEQRGTVRLLETGRSSLERCGVLACVVLRLTVRCRSLMEWQALVGQEPEGPLRMEYERKSGQDVSSPKHGKVSPVRFEARSSVHYIVLLSLKEG